MAPVSYLTAQEPGSILRPDTTTKYSTILSIVGSIMIAVKYDQANDEKSRKNWQCNFQNLINHIGLFLVSRGRIIIIESGFMSFVIDNFWMIAIIGSENQAFNILD